MSKADVRVCRYVNCPHQNKIDLATDDYKVVGKSMYYHTDCLKEKKQRESKDDKTKADFQYIKNQWVLHIDQSVVFSRLFQCLNEFLSRGISSDYLVFTLDYVIKHKMKLNYPDGLKYYVSRKEIKTAYEKNRAKNLERPKFTVEEDKFDDPATIEPIRINKSKPKGFGSILKNKKTQED